MENLLFTGDRALLKDSAVPSIFPFRTSPQVSTSRSERVQRRSQKEAACPLNNGQYEIEVNYDEIVLKKGNRIYHRGHNVQAMLYMFYSL